MVPVQIPPKGRLMWLSRRQTKEASGHLRQQDQDSASGPSGGSDWMGHRKAWVVVWMVEVLLQGL